MQIVPAIDILEGKVVRLNQGDYDKASHYTHDLLHYAKAFAAQSYSHLHIIDLSGAKKGSPQILKEIESLLPLGLNIQVGGGIRTLESARAYLERGVKHVIIGTQALIQPSFVEELVGAFGSDPIIVSVDVRNGKLGIQGWLEEHPCTIEEVLARLIQQGIKRVIVTDITRDGTLSGTNIELYKPLVKEFACLELYAAGGVASNNDIEELSRIGVAGAIVGKAFYEKNLFMRGDGTC